MNHSRLNTDGINMIYCYDTQIIRYQSVINKISGTGMYVHIHL